MYQGWLLLTVAIGIALGTLFAAYPLWDVQVADWFYDHQAHEFPLATNYEWNIVRRFANWITYILLLPPLLALLRKLIFPSLPMLIAPSIVIYLLGSFLIGPGVISNLLLKENWGRPRPNKIEQFAGTFPFQPWWRPSHDCKRNCSFVSGETSAAFWTVAPASLAPPEVRPVALGTAVLFGAAVGALRVAFGRHFVTDAVFAGVFTILVVMALHKFCLSPLKRNDARLERGIERFSVILQKGFRALVAETMRALGNRNLLSNVDQESGPSK
jgi:lipid A 4'-phosphatase